jgi:hypothetical protein
MAIPEGRLATDWESTAGAYAVPEDRRFYAFVNYERGPIDIEDPGQVSCLQHSVLFFDFVYV